MHRIERTDGDPLPVSRPLCLPSGSALLSINCRKGASPCAFWLFGTFMKMRASVPVKPTSAAEPMRHGRLGGRGSSAIRLGIVAFNNSKRNPS